MCGLAVIVSSQRGDVGLGDVIERMTAAIVHRGPDDEGTYVSERVAMGFRRLSILDTSPLGHQPMLSDDEQVVLVFNGEIYNYLELRDELTALGHHFRSTGDTEVLLKAYLEWGNDCVSRFRGMWAFVIYDKREQRLFGSRDRFGMKPLYRYGDRTRTLFGSEIKAIRASGLYQGGTNWRTASRYLLEERLDDTLESFYDGIDQIAPGSSFELTVDGQFRQWRYWSLENAPRFEGNDPTGSLAELLEDAVRLHMRSDVPLGVHLSGGLDSTSILCAAARARKANASNEPLMAFSYIAPEFDESRFISDTIEQTAATLVKLDTEPKRLWDLLEDVLEHQDEPIYSMMPLVSYELMRLAKSNGIKVVLNGQGADETIAGYPSYFGDYWTGGLYSGALYSVWREIGAHASVHGGERGALFLKHLKYAMKSRIARTSPYRALANWRRRRAYRSNAWYTAELAEYLPDEQNAAPSSLHDSLLYSVYRTPLPRILRVEDRNSMAHSIEARLPFLDHRLAEFCFGLAPEWLLRGPWNKFVLREAMRGRIPESVRTRADKMGFPVPATSWLSGPLYEPVLDLLTSRTARERGIYKVDSILRDVANHRRGGAVFQGPLFDIAQFEVWSAL